MRDDELRESVRLMSEGDRSSNTDAQRRAGVHHIVQQVARRRRQRALGAAIGAVVAVVAVVVVSFSVVGDPVSGPAPAHSPAVSHTPDAPTSPPDSGRMSQCEVGVEVGQSRWAANADAATAAAAARAWALPGETIQSDTDGRRTYIAFLGQTAVRMVAELKQEDDGWYGRGLTACVHPDEVNTGSRSADSCGPIVRWKGRTYVARVGEPALGPGSILGDAVIPDCASLPTLDDRLHQVQGTLQPVTAYGYSEVSPNEQIVLVIDQRPVGYRNVEGSPRAVVPSHCGVISVTVDGELWLAEPPLGGHNPPRGWEENETHGYFVVTGARRAEFYGDGGQKAHFRLASDGTVDPGAGCE